jgi:uncharacterized protein
MVFSMRPLLFFLFFLFNLEAQPGYFEPWGKDSDLIKPPSKKQELKSSLLTKISDAIIVFHQQVISPADGPRSHFRPTSSRYMQLAIHRYGFFKGYVMGCDRLLRENDEKWVYQTIKIDNQDFKFDPALEDKHLR